MAFDDVHAAPSLVFVAFVLELAAYKAPLVRPTPDLAIAYRSDSGQYDENAAAELDCQAPQHSFFLLETFLPIG